MLHFKNVDYPSLCIKKGEFQWTFKGELILFKNQLFKVSLGILAEKVSCQ